MSSPNTPCAACKFLRRKCTQECVFAQYFPPDQPQKFANVHKVFGASNVAKILNEINRTQRDDAVNSLAYEADARLRDPVYGCVRLISVLQHRLKQVQKDLDDAKMELVKYIGPSALLPVLNQGFIPQTGNMSSSSEPVLPYNMQPMISVDGNFPDPRDHPHIIDIRQQEQQELLINYEQQQHQPSQQQQPVDLVRHMIGSGFNPAAMTLSLSLCSAYVNNTYQIQQQPQEQKPHLQPHQLSFEQETKQLQPAVLLALRTAGEEDRSVAPSC